MKRLAFSSEFRCAFIEIAASRKTRTGTTNDSDAKVHFFVFCHYDCLTRNGGDKPHG